MSSWCPFRCTCLDELESKCDVNFMRHVCLNCDFHVVQSLRFMDDFFLVWRHFFGVVMDDSKTFAGFDGADFKDSLDSSNCSKTRAFGFIWGRMPSLGFFRVRMSSWCPFRCTCLDELESKCDVKFMRHVRLNCDFHVILDTKAHG